MTKDPQNYLLLSKFTDLSIQMYPHTILQTFEREMCRLQNPVLLYTCSRTRDRERFFLPAAEASRSRCDAFLPFCVFDAFFGMEAEGTHPSSR